MASSAIIVESLFERALSMPMPDRRRFLTTIEPAELRAEVEDLLERSVAGRALALDLEGAVNRAADALFGDGPDSHVGKRIGRFEVRSVLGDGSHAQVYLAFDPELRREVAIKVLRVSARASVDRFMTEARAVSALNHPHIGVVYEIGETAGGERYIVMPRYTGRTLAEILRDGPLSASLAVEIAAQLADALRTAHAAGIVHRDVKAANVIFESEDSVRLLDFGIAKLARAHQTEAGVVLGTVAYMSPEQTRGSEVDPRTDVWSLGVLLYEMLTGRKPFDGDEAGVVINQIRHDEPADLSSLPGRLQRTVAFALAKDPDKRFASMDDLLDALTREDDLAGAGSGAGSLRVFRLWRINRLATAIMLLVAVAAATGVYLLVPRAAEAPNQIAVMPFENRSSNPDDKFLSEEMSAQLREQLGRVDGLNVIGRASSGELLHEGFDATTVATMLGVRWLVIGDIERSSDRIRMTVAIIDGASGLEVWSERYDSEQDSLLVVHQLVIEDVARQLVPGSLDRSIVSDLAVNSEAAFSLMLVADNYFHRALDQTVIDQELLDEAVRIYRQAVAEEPASALLNSRLGAALLYKAELDAAELHIERARASGGHRSHVQHTLGLYLYARHEDGVGEHLRRAVELNSNNVDALEDYGLYLYAQADVAGARHYLERARMLDPMSVRRYEALGNFYGTNGFYDDALDLALQIPQTFDDAAAYLVVSRIYELTGDLDKAIGWAELALRRDPAHQAASWRLAELYTRIGDLETAQGFDTEPSVAKLYFSRRYEELIDLAFDLVLEGGSPATLFTLARAYAATDRYEPAIRVLANQGLPGNLQRDSATTSEIEAGVNLADALMEAGQTEEAMKLAEYLTTLFRRWAVGMPESWHPQINLACLLSVSGEEEQALAALERMAASRGLPWYPIIRDQPCFRKRFAGNPRYEAVLETIVERKRRLREKLPLTLQGMGVTQSHGGLKGRIRMEASILPER